MRFDIVTIFPEFFAGPLDYGIIRRARAAGLIEAHVHDLRNFAHDRHRTVDDRPFGGGQGMVLKPEPLFEAVESLRGARADPRATVVLLSASGKLFRQETASRWAERERIVLLCGRYEGVDERVAEHLADVEISVGDFVVSGGELPAAMVVDAVTRLLPGALGNEASAVEESFSAPPLAPRDRRSEPCAVSSVDAGRARDSAAHASSSFSHQLQALSIGTLDCPHYTRPQVFRGWAVPEVLVSGNHEQIRQWRRQQALAKTLRNRPDLLDPAALGDEDRGLLADLWQRVKA
jgi:tRNA (guanine37-N1)-methyltransferase